MMAMIVRASLARQAVKSTLACRALSTQRTQKQARQSSQPICSIPSSSTSKQTLSRRWPAVGEHTSYAKRRYATHATTGDGTSASSTRTMPSPDLESSVDAILAEDVLAAVETQKDVAPLPRSIARQAISITLQQLRDSVDAKSREEAQQLESRADEQIRTLMQQENISANALHHFTIALLKHSRDPRRTPIASRLFVTAFGVDPMTLPDPTAPRKDKEFPTKGVDESLASIAIAGKDAWAVNAAGYNWASMVLSGQAAPPAGLHLLARGTKEVRELITEQQAAAIRIYATLAMRGDPQGMLGMGRILIAGLNRQEAAASSSSGQQDDKEKAEAKQKQNTMMRDRALALWTRAGEKGISDAWFELGLLTLGTAEGQAKESAAELQAKANSYFDRGAKAGNARCHHALGVLMTQQAMQNNQSPSPPERNESLQKSMDHFREAAGLGDGESAHHMGMRYLLRQEMLEEVGLGSDQDGRSSDEVRAQASNRHTALWGVEPDDVEARKWFALGSDAGFMPAMMNFAGMLVEQRGAEEGQDQQARLQDLRKAESLYAKVSATAGAMARQEQQQQDPNGAADGATGTISTGHMAAFAQEALGKVQEEIKQVAGASSPL